MGERRPAHGVPLALGEVPPSDRRRARAASAARPGSAARREVARACGAWACSGPITRQPALVARGPAGEVVVAAAAAAGPIGPPRAKAIGNGATAASSSPAAPNTTTAAATAVDEPSSQQVTSSSQGTLHLL